MISSGYVILLSVLYFDTSASVCRLYLLCYFLFCIQNPCRKCFTQSVVNVQDENEKVILAYVAMRSAKLALQYKEAVANITPFPDNDEVLSAKVSAFGFL